MKNKQFVIQWLILLSISTLCSAAVITVDDNGPANYATIQEAINAAEFGDIIQVAPGRYFENIDFHGKAITLTSTNPQDFNIVSTTIIDANRNDIAVSFHTDEDPNSIIDGFTITNGLAKYGAGICCWKGCSPTIKNCIIKDNDSGSFVGFRGGAGIYCLDFSSPNIFKCTITSNSTYSGGGGICCINNSNPIIDECVISNNTATLRGGGIHSENNSNPTIINSTIISNTAQYGGGVCCYKNSSVTIDNCSITANNSTSSNGGGLNCQNDSTAIISNSIISNNNANWKGGGLQCDSNSSLTVIACSISNNTAETGGGVYCGVDSTCYLGGCTINDNYAYEFGGGLSFEESYDSVIINCTICNNYALYGGGGIDCGENTFPLITNNIICNSTSGYGIYAFYSDPIIAYNNVWDNFDGEYGGWAWPITGDISVDPLFSDNNYHLHYNSPCINAGDPAFIGEPLEVDIDDQPRIRLGRVDIGADEAGSNPADFNESGYVNLIDYHFLAAAWLSQPHQNHWNPICDIATPSDQIINIRDLITYLNEWLWQALWYIH